MKRFWGRGAIAMSALLAVVAFGSFLAGENLSRLGASHATAAAATSTQPTSVSGTPTQQPPPGRGPRHPRRGDPGRGFFPSGELGEP